MQPTTKSESAALESFGRLIISTLYDAPLSSLYEKLYPEKFHKLADQAKTLRTQITALTPAQKELVVTLVEDALTRGIHDFLFQIVEHTDLNKELQVTYAGYHISKISDQLNSEIYAQDGWVAQYSTQKPENSYAVHCSKL